MYDMTEINPAGAFMAAAQPQRMNALSKPRSDQYNALARHGGPTRAAADEANGGMSSEALQAYESLMEAWGRDLKVNSAYRSPEHNERVGGAKHSQHTHGNAYDFDVSDLSLEDRIPLIQLAREIGFGGVGVYDNALHFDVGDVRDWGRNYSSDSTPAWAIPYLRG